MTTAVDTASSADRAQAIANLYRRCERPARGTVILEMATLGVGLELAGLCLSVYDLYRAITEHREAENQARVLLESQCGQVLALVRQSHELATVTDAFKILRCVKILNVACLGIGVAGALFDAIIAVRTRAEALRAEEAARSGTRCDDEVRTWLQEHDTVRADLGRELSDAAAQKKERTMTAYLALPEPTSPLPCNTIADACPRPPSVDASTSLSHSSQSLRHERRKFLQQHKQGKKINHVE